MRTLVAFTENYVRGGGNLYMVDAVNALATEFDQVIVATNPGGLFPQDYPMFKGPITFREFPFFTNARIQQHHRWLPPLGAKIALRLARPLEPWWFMRNLCLGLHWLRRWEPRMLLVCNGGYPAAAGALAMAVAGGLARVPTAMSIVSMPTPRRPDMYLFDSLVDRLVGRYVDMLVPNAGEISRELVSGHGLPPERIRVIHNCIPDVPLSRPAPRPSDECHIGFFSRVDRAKGVFHLLEAFSGLADRFPGIRLRIVGIQGDAGKAFTDQVAASPQASRISVEGPYEGDIPSLLAGFDIFAFPSLREGFPYAVIEAMRSGCPVVASRIGGIPEAITDGEDGLIVDPGSTASLQAALERLVSDPTCRARLGINARQRFLRQFERRHMYNHFRSLAVSLLPQ